MQKLRPSIVSNNLIDIFNASNVNIKVKDGGGNFKVDLQDGLESKDIHDIVTLQIIRYINYKFLAKNIEKAKSLAIFKISTLIKARVIEFNEIWEKKMIQHLGSSIKDKNKKPLFFKCERLSNATVFKFSHLNIGGQNSNLKKLGLGLEFFEKDGKLEKIYIHRFDNKH